MLVDKCSSNMNPKAKNMKNFYFGQLQLIGKNGKNSFTENVIQMKYSGFFLCFFFLCYCINMMESK